MPGEVSGEGIGVVRFYCRPVVYKRRVSRPSILQLHGELALQRAIIFRMLYSSSAAFLYSLAGLANGLPAPAPQASGVSGGSSVPGPVDPSQVLNMPLPSSASGSLRSSDDLQGYNPSNPVDMQSTVIPPEDFELAPGQSEDEDLGLYIDLTNVKNPQPIRGGTTGPTEPGPR